MSFFSLSKNYFYSRANPRPFLESSSNFLSFYVNFSLFGAILRNLEPFKAYASEPIFTRGRGYRVISPEYGGNPFTLSHIMHLKNKFLKFVDFWPIALLSQNHNVTHFDKMIEYAIFLTFSVFVVDSITTGTVF